MQVLNPAFCVPDVTSYSCRHFQIILWHWGSSNLLLLYDMLPIFLGSCCNVLF